ncbi:hypothetical protein HDU76_005759 [Blyttiomyces sp. JEL0837]|nr:hypothetical protein HDU76_005759 [Blyttiomyces sp. JEL0837]
MPPKAKKADKAEKSEDLHGQVPKAMVTKLLAQLQETQQIHGKQYGKSWVYVAKQDEPGDEGDVDINQMERDIEALQEQVTALKAENSKAEKEFNEITSSLKDDELREEIDRLEHENTSLQERLDTVRKGKVKISIEDKKKAEKEFDECRKQWRVRKRWFNDAWGAITESMDKGNRNELSETLGIETDEAAGVDFQRDPLEALNI